MGGLRRLYTGNFLEVGYKEGSSKSQNSIKFREYSKDHGLTENIKTRTNSCNTVCTYLTLTNG